MTAILQATHISIMPRPLQHALCLYLEPKVSYYYLSNTSRVAQADVVASRYTAEGSVDWNTSIWFCCTKKKSLMEDKRNNEVQRLVGTKRHISLVSLLLWCKIVAVQCFVWRLGSQMWSGSEAGSQADRRNFKLL